MGLGLNFALGVPVIDVAAHGSSVDSCRERWQGDGEQWGEGEGGPIPLPSWPHSPLGPKSIP